MNVLGKMQIKTIMVWVIITLLSGLSIAHSMEENYENRILGYMENAERYEANGEYLKASREYERGVNFSIQHCILNYGIYFYNKSLELGLKKSKGEVMDGWLNLCDKIFYAPCMGSWSSAADCYLEAAEYLEEGEKKEFYREIGDKYARFIQKSSSYAAAVKSKYAAKFYLKAGEYEKAGEYANLSIEKYGEYYSKLPEDLISREWLFISILAPTLIKNVLKKQMNSTGILFV